ncbi:MAG TPA: hypothetical protein VGO93_23610 [Candidatus Xenobia bacterium]|jgi:hypothetical protein
MNLVTSHSKTPRVRANPKVTAADVRATEIVDLTPTATAGRHATYTARMADSGEQVFVKHAALENLFKGRMGQKLNQPMAQAMQSTFPHLDRFQDMADVMLSHFAKAYFNEQGRRYSGVTYSEVLARKAQGENKLLIAAPMVEHLGTLQDVPVTQVTNGAEAVEGTLLKGLILGDYDVSLNNSNNTLALEDGHLSDGTPLQKGQVVMMDYGEAGNANHRWLGMPYGSVALLTQFPQHIQPAIENILKLDDKKIRQLVEQGGQQVTGWNDTLTDHFTRNLEKNLDKLRQEYARDPDQFDPRNSPNPLRHPEHAERKMYVTFPRGLANYASLKMSGVLNGVPDNQETADQIAALLPPWPGSHSTN